MAVQTPQLKIDPYQSTVPLVQIPVEQMGGGGPAQPLQGQFGRKGTGALAIGDAMLKGFMQGHKVKEQRKQAQAEATINAADAASAAAYQTYQDALTKVGGNEKDPAAEAAYQSYVQTFQAGKQAKAQFVIPEKPQKGKKGEAGAAKSPDGKKEKTARAGFNSIKDFFEANPHIVPQIALITMQPKPPGLSAQGQQQVQSSQGAELENQRKQQEVNTAKQKQDDLNFVALHQSLTPEQIAALPADEQKQLAASKFRLEQAGPAKAKFTTWQSADGNQFLVLPDGEQPPPGYSPWEKTTAGTGLGSKSWQLTRAAQIWGIPVNQLTPADQNYLDSMAAYSKKRAQLTASASGSSTSVTGDRESWIRQQIGPPPVPPTGRKPIDAATFQQGIQPPPAGQGQASAGSGGLGPPSTSGATPAAQGVPSTAAQGSTQFTVGPKPKGMVEEGNLPIWNRPTVQNANGSHSSEFSFSMQDDQGNEVLVPMIVDGKWLTPDGKMPTGPETSPAWQALKAKAWKHYEETGENLGKFDSPKSADAYARKLHNRGSGKATSKGGTQPPPTAGKTTKTGTPQPPGYKPTALTASVTRQATTAKENAYATARINRDKAKQTADRQYAADSAKYTPEMAEQLRQGAYQAADDEYNAKINQADKDYTAAVRSIGGTPVGQSGGGQVTFTLPNGGTITGTQERIDAFKEANNL